MQGETPLRGASQGYSLPDEPIKGRIMYSANTEKAKKERNRLLSALFAEAAKRGIDAERLRDEIAPGRIGKRLSEASAKEIYEVGVHIAGWKPRKRRTRRIPAPQGLPTLEHTKLLQDLYVQIGWVDTARQKGFNKRMCGKPWPQTVKEVNDIIEAVKAMRDKNYSERVPRKEEK